MILERGGKIKVFEFKASKTPKPSRGFFELTNALSPDEAYIVAPVDDSYEYRKNVFVVNLDLQQG